VPFFERLAPTSLEKLAMRVRPLAIAAGTELIREGGGRQSLLPHRVGFDVIHGGKLVATLGTGQ
jgi:hypothetical protein